MSVFNSLMFSVAHSHDSFLDRGNGRSAVEADLLLLQQQQQQPQLVVTV